MTLLEKPSKSINSSSILNSSHKTIGRRGLERIDFLLLLIETIEINGVQSLMLTSRDLGLDNTFSNRVELWKTRAHNPLRRSSRRGKPSDRDIKALISLISATSNRLYPLLRQLLSNKEPKEITYRRWDALNNRFTDLIKERMNIKREGVQKLLSRTDSHSFLRELVLILALSTGIQGLSRLENYIYHID